MAQALETIMDIEPDAGTARTTVDHKGTVRIETERLILRPFTADDVAPAFRNWLSDEQVTRYLRWQAYHDIDDARDVIGRWIASYPDASFYHWAIELRELHEPIGTISVVGQDERTDTVHIGYCIGSAWWHLGIASEALGAIIPFFFSEVHVNRIESQHDPANPYSGAVMRKCGMSYEGTLRKADWSNQGIVDACMYSLLRDEREA